MDNTTPNPNQEMRDDEPNWLKLSRKLEEQYAQSRKCPLKSSYEERMKMMEARYGKPIKVKK